MHKYGTSLYIDDKLWVGSNSFSLRIVMSCQLNGIHRTSIEAWLIIPLNNIVNIHLHGIV